MKMNGRLVRMVLMLVLVTLTMSQMVASAGSDGKVSLQRGSHELRGADARSTPFGGNGGRLNADVCSGSCNCSSCSCTGTLSCCIGGCEACWDYRDDQGLCGPVS